MIIHFERSGGVTGILVSSTIDTRTLEAKDAAALTSLLDAIDFFNLPEKNEPPTYEVDYFEYRLTVSTDDQRSHTVAFHNSAPSQEIQHLVRYMMYLTREQLDQNSDVNTSKS